MVPADQGLEAFEALLRHAVERLEVQLEVAFAHRLAEIEFQLAAAAGFLVERGFEEVVGALAFALGAVEREIGVLEQFVAARAVLWAHRHAEAGGQLHGSAADGDIRVERAVDLARQRGRVRAFAQTGDEQAELVAAEACDHVIGEQVLQPLSGLAQQRIANGVAHRVVDHLEIVEIDEDGHRAVRRALARDRAVELLDEETAVGQARQAIVERAVDDLAFAFLDRIDHRVEALRQRRDLGIARNIDLGDGAAGIAPRRFGQLAEGPRDASRNAQAQREAGERAGQRDADKRGVERAVGLHRGIERVAEDEARLDPALEAGQRGEPHQLATLRRGQLADGAKAQRGLLRRKRAGGGDLGLDRHGGKAAERAEVLRAERLGKHQPAGEIGHFDGGGDGERKLAPLRDNAAVPACIKRGEEGGAIERRRARACDHRAIERDDRRDRGAGAGRKGGERGAERGLVAPGNGAAEAEIARDDGSGFAHLPFAGGDQLFEQEADAAARNEHRNRHDPGQQRHQQNGDAGAQRAGTQVGDAGKERVRHWLSAALC